MGETTRHTKNKLGFTLRTAAKSMANPFLSAANQSIEAPNQMALDELRRSCEEENFMASHGFQTSVMKQNFLEIGLTISELHKLATWDKTNIFDIHEKLEGHTLLVYLPLMFEHFGFVGETGKESKLCTDYSTLFAWLNRVAQEGYNRIPYHSSVHAADVLQTVFFWVTRTESEVLSLLTEEDIFAMLIGAAIHDYQHPGISHPYLVQADHTSRYIYNDRDILENFHLCQAFKMMKQYDLDIFRHLSKRQKRIVKRNVVDCVLATNFGHQNELIFDMQNDKKYIHGKDISTKDLSRREIRRTRKILRPLLLHTSDISHCFKRESIHLEWSERYFQEYYIEKAMLVDKGVLASGVRRQDFPKEQVFFFKLWCLPFYDMLAEWLDMPETEYIINTGKSNHDYWASGKGTAVFTKVSARNF